MLKPKVVDRLEPIGSVKAAALKDTRKGPRDDYEWQLMYDQTATVGPSGKKRSAKQRESDADRTWRKFHPLSKLEER